MKASSDMILAFAFSLLPDGSPGSYNEIIAQQIHERIEKSKRQSVGLPLFALQWEIADALIDLYPLMVKSLRDQQKLFVIEPPRFKASEVDENQIESWLETNTGQAGQTLLACLNDTEGSSVLSRLNKLLDNGSLFKKFSSIEFANLKRPDLGELFTEYREKPSVSNYLNGLRRYQRVRVNRLILESIVHDRNILKSGRYLSTPGVIDSALDFFPASPQLKNIQLLAHPLHLPRCNKQINDAFTARNLDIKITNEVAEQIFPWDDRGAQVWCRSLANWNRYEALVQTWLKAQQ
jgi:hypothetical protein